MGHQRIASGFPSHDHNPTDVRAFADCFRCADIGSNLPQARLNEGLLRRALARVLTGRHRRFGTESAEELSASRYDKNGTNQGQQDSTDCKLSKMRP
jgi:hypothetical protein